MPAKRFRVCALAALTLFANTGSQMVERKMKVLFTEVFSPSNLTNLGLAVGTVYGIAMYEASLLLKKTSWKFNALYARYC